MYSHINEKNLSDRLSVADILSSMANGVEESQSTVACTTIDGMTCGIPTRTTPTLTPTTLRNIEESFMELHSIPPAPLEHQHQAGFAPPIVSFTGLPKQEESSHWMDDCMQHSSDRSLDSPRPPSEASTSSCSKPSKSRRSGGRRPMKDERLSPEEEERRRIRRERNKLAAARCRKRRMELTTNLMQETDILEEKRQSLQNEIQLLQCQKDELEFLLEAHKATCKLNSQHSKAKSSSDTKLSSNRYNKYQRPNSLSLTSNFNFSDSPLKSSPSLSTINEINSSLNTPSTGLFQFENMVEGAANSNLPLVITSISSCGGQQRSSSSDLSSPDSIAPPKLVSL